MKLKNLPPFKAGDIITFKCTDTRYEHVVLKVEKGVHNWYVTFRMAGMFGWILYQITGTCFTESAKYFRRVK